MKIILGLCLPLILFAQVPASDSGPQAKLLANRWSFGTAYIPRYTDVAFDVLLDQYTRIDIDLVRMENELALMQATLSFRLHSNAQISLDVGYTLNSIYSRNERHIYYDDPQYEDSDEGFLQENRIGKFRFLVSLKGYLRTPAVKQVSPFVRIGVGKQIAGTTIRKETLFDNNPPEIEIETNIEEFLRDMNSPFLFNAGFGVEYPFNPFLAFFSVIQFDYARISAMYDAREIGTGITRTITEKYRDSQVFTRIGLGFNFYF